MGDNSSLFIAAMVNPWALARPNVRIARPRARLGDGGVRGQRRCCRARAEWAGLHQLLGERDGRPLLPRPAHGERGGRPAGRQLVDEERESSVRQRKRAVWPRPQLVHDLGGWIDRRARVPRAELRGRSRGTRSTTRTVTRASSGWNGMQTERRTSAYRSWTARIRLATGCFAQESSTSSEVGSSEPPRGAPRRKLGRGQAVFSNT